jgi:hypothetical protein
VLHGSCSWLSAILLGLQEALVQQLLQELCGLCGNRLLCRFLLLLPALLCRQLLQQLCGASSHGGAAVQLLLGPCQELLQQLGGCAGCCCCLFGRWMPLLLVLQNKLRLQKLRQKQHHLLSCGWSEGLVCLGYLSMLLLLLLLDAGTRQRAGLTHQLPEELRGARSGCGGGAGEETTLALAVVCWHLLRQQVLPERRGPARCRALTLALLAAWKHVQPRQP